jgi:hypothetical protein
MFASSCTPLTGTLCEPQGWMQCNCIQNIASSQAVALRAGCSNWEERPALLDQRGYSTTGCYHADTILPQKRDML